MFSLFFSHFLSLFLPFFLHTFNYFFFLLSFFILSLSMIFNFSFLFLIFFIFFSSVQGSDYTVTVNYYKNSNCSNQIGDEKQYAGYYNAATGGTSVAYIKTDCENLNLPPGAFSLNAACGVPEGSFRQFTVWYSETTDCSSSGPQASYNQGSVAGCLQTFASPGTFQARSVTVECKKNSAFATRSAQMAIFAVAIAVIIAISGF